jgi:hypothetical protein
MAMPGVIARPIAGTTTIPRTERPREIVTQNPPQMRRRGIGLIATLGVITILSALSIILFLNLQGVANATITITPRQGADLGLVRVDVPVLIGAAADLRGPGLAAPGIVSGTTTVTGTTPLTGTLVPVPDSPRVAEPVQAQTINTSFSSNKTVPATGVKQVPDKPATGTIRFTNRGSTAIGVPAGTKLTGSNGKVFHTVAAATVPATDFVNLVFGIREVNIQADEAGPASNGADVSGGYGNATFITINRPSGGNTRPVKIVDAKDLAALQDQLKTDLQDRASGEILGKVPPDRQPLTCTLHLPSSDADYALSALPAVGDEAETISGAMTTTASVAVYSPAEVRHQAAKALRDAVPANLPAMLQATVDASSVDETRLVLVQATGCDNNKVVFRTEAAPRLLYSFTQLPPALADQLKNKVLNQTPEQAVATIKADPALQPYIADVKVQASKASPFQQDLVLPAAPANINVRLDPGASRPRTGGGGAITSTTLPPAPAAPTATGEPK